MRLHLTKVGTANYTHVTQEEPQMPAPKNRAGRRGSKAESPSDTTRRYSSTARVVEARCPRDDCRGVFAADTQDQVDQAVQDHLDSAHDSTEGQE